MCDLKQKRYIVHVKGDIIVTDNTVQCAQGWACYGFTTPNSADNYIPQEPNEISANLHLSEDRACIPYALYVSEKGISGGGITLFPGYGAAIVYAKTELERIKKALNTEIPLCLRNSFYKGLYIECFSCIEQFFCDFLLCGVYNIPGCYKRAEEFRNGKPTEKRKKDLHTFCYSFVYHQFDKTAKMYQKVLEIELPDMSFFKSQNIRRNDIVHRTSLNKLDRMTYRIISKCDIEEMIAQIENLLRAMSNISEVEYEYVEQLVNEVQNH